MKSENFCHKCKKTVTLKEVRVLTLTGEGIKEFRCPECNELFYREKFGKEIPGLPRRIPKFLKGLYIAFEGIDGSGKTYHSQQVVEKLKKLGFNVIYVKEPHIGAVKKFIHRSAKEIDSDAEAYIFAADRIILQKTVILPALENGEIIISDRSVYASLAYQVARRLNEHFILSINRSIKFPDKVILLDITPKEALKRIQESGRKFTRFEEEEFARKVRKRYLELAKQKRGKFIVIDSDREKDLVENEIWKNIKTLLKL